MKNVFYKDPVKDLTDVHDPIRTSSNNAHMLLANDVSKGETADF